MMEPESGSEKGIIPRWLWAALAVLLVGLVIALFVYDKPPEPGNALLYDIAPFTDVKPAEITFRETNLFPVDIPAPNAMAVGQNGCLYVAGDGFIITLSAEGKETARFEVKEQPMCLAVQPVGTVSAGNLLVGMRNHIEIINSNGDPVATWPSLDEKGCFTSLAANTDGVYAADAGNRIVLFYGYDGVLKNRLGAEDPKREIPGFIVPSPYFDLAFDPSGVLWVVNPGRHGLESYRSNGDLVSSWYHSGMGLADFCGCCNPIHIAFRSDNTLVTAEKGLNRVKLYAPDNSLLGIVVTPETMQTHYNGSLTGTEEPPIADLAVDAQDRVLVLDRYKKAIRIFEQQKTL